MGNSDEGDAIGIVNGREEKPRELPDEYPPFPTDRALALLGANNIRGGFGQDTNGLANYERGVAVLYDNDVEGGVSDVEDGGTAMGIRNIGLLWLVRNTIRGASEVACCEGTNMGIVLEGEGSDHSVTLRFNTISAGGLRGNTAVGIYGKHVGDLLVEYNEIRGGIGDSSAFGVLLEDATGSLSLRFNTLEGGLSRSNATGLVFQRADATVDFNTIIGGAGGTGFGVLFSYGSMTLRGNDIQGCHLASDRETPACFGVHFGQEESVSLLEGNRIVGGAAGGLAVGVVMSGMTTMIDNNITGGEGIAVFGLLDGTVRLATIVGNRITAGRSLVATAIGVYLSNGFSTFMNNHIDAGESGFEGESVTVGFWKASGATAFLINNTIYGGRSLNSIEGYGSFGLFVESNGDGSSAWVINNIIDPGVADGGGRSIGVLLSNLEEEDAPLVLFGNLIWGPRMTGILSDDEGESFVGTATALNSCTWQGCRRAGGNISVDPLLNLAAGDARLPLASPAIDSGVDPSSEGVSNPTDINGLPRPFGRHDIGAFERTPDFGE